MSMFNTETRTRSARCRIHGPVTAEKQVPKLKFPFVITGLWRGFAALRPYRCPTCGAKAT
jgi:hypothetical protein